MGLWNNRPDRVLKLVAEYTRSSGIYLTCEKPGSVNLSLIVFKTVDYRFSSMNALSCDLDRAPTFREQMFA